MPMNFPDTPVNGNTFTSGSSSWVWVSPPGAWKSATGSSGSPPLYLPLTGGQLNPGGLLIGTAGVVPPAGMLTLNANTVALSGAVGSNLYIAGADTASVIIVLDAFAAANSAAVLQRRARGTGAAPTAVQNGDNFAFLGGIGYGATGYGASYSALVINAAENWTATAQGSRMTFFTTPTGATTGVTSLVLQGNTATFSGGVGIGSAATAPDNGNLRLNANTVVPTGAPASNFYAVGADGASTVTYLDCFSNVAGACCIIGTRRARGTAAAPLVPNGGDLLASFGINGYNGTATPAQAVAINSNTTETWSGTANGAALYLYSTATGTNALTQSLALLGNTATFFGGQAATNGMVAISTPSGVDAQVQLNCSATSGGHTYNLLSRGVSGGGFGGFWIWDATAGATRFFIDVNGNSTFNGNVTANTNLYIGTSGTIWFYDALSGLIGVNGGGGLQINGVGIKYPNANGGSPNIIAFGWSNIVSGLATVTIDNGGAKYAIANGSDIRLKQDIAPSTYDCLDTVLQLPLFEFRWRDITDPWKLKESKSRADAPLKRVGVIAQKVHEIFPEGVFPGEDFDDHLGTVWNLDSNTMIALLVGAVKQLTARVAELESR